MGIGGFGHEIALRPLPVIHVSAQPADALDAGTKRIIDKELRAAGWAGRRAKWIAGVKRGGAPGSILNLSCHSDDTAVAIARRMRFSLGHLVAGVRARLPEWAVVADLHGSDGALHLEWGRDVGLNDAAESLVRADASALNLGGWAWDPAAHRWRERDE